MVLQLAELSHLDRGPVAPPLLAVGFTGRTILAKARTMQSVCAHLGQAQPVQLEVSMLAAASIVIAPIDPRPHHLASLDQLNPDTRQPRFFQQTFDPMGTIVVLVRRLQLPQ